MPSNYGKSSHAIYDIKYHLIWVTKYRYQMLSGQMAKRLRTLIRQGRGARKIAILGGNIGKDHAHLLISSTPSMSPGKIVQYLKGRSSRLLQEEYTGLKKKYWGQHLWARGYFCATAGAVDEETIRRYIENQDNEEDKDKFDISDE